MIPESLNVFIFRYLHKTQRGIVKNGGTFSRQTGDGISRCQARKLVLASKRSKASSMNGSTRISDPENIPLSIPKTPLTQTRISCPARIEAIQYNPIFIKTETETGKIRRELVKRNSQS